MFFLKAETFEELEKVRSLADFTNEKEILYARCYELYNKDFHFRNNRNFNKNRFYIMCHTQSKKDLNNNNY